MSQTASTAQQGFTVIEAMIALAILGISTVGIIRALEAHVDTLRGLEQRSAAQWVAENALTEAALGVRDATIGGGEVAMLGMRWSVRVATARSDDADIRVATVHVSPAGRSDVSMVTLRGFIDGGTVTP